ncbi:DUF1461 domain-containing protein [Candidatus Woesearchaeota archaeon]|nr:DUF1461 domain-containing protein [Candidatus Woesearchaeota archaeon]
MKLISFAKFLLVLIIPLMLFLIVLNITGFDDLFYKEKFDEYNVEENVPKADSLHQKVMGFIKGDSNDLPSEFNEKEKQHLRDVRKLIGFGTVVMYILVILFIGLLAFSAFTLKASTYINKFVGKVLLFGGLLTLGLALLVFVLISADFDSSFESFHKMLFEYGTYSFDASKEMIVNLYPEQLFMDLGIRISKHIIITSSLIALAGVFLLFKSKRE